jgi:uncharacterized membrane protein
MNTKLSKGLWGLSAFLSVGVALFSYRLLAPDPFVGPEVLANHFARPWLFVHAGFAATALLVGPFQFLPKLRGRRPRLHRWLGRVYVFSCLAGGASGLALAAGTAAGPVAAAGFGTLAVAWLLTTGQAFRHAVARRIAEHRRWMVRSFALTLAAVTLRIYLPFPPMMGMEFQDGYVAISWLAWVPNLIVAELYLARGRTRLAGAAA